MISLTDALLLLLQERQAFDNINGFVERELKYFEFAADSVWAQLNWVCLGSSEGQQITKGIKLMKFELFCYTE